MYYVHILSPVHLSIDSMFACCMCSGILHFVLPSLTCYQCDLQYQVSVSRGNSACPAAKHQPRKALHVFEDVTVGLVELGNLVAKRHANSNDMPICNMICHDLLLLHTVPFMLKLRFTKHPVCWTQAKLPRDSPKRCSEPPSIKLSFNGAHLGLQGDTR